MKKKLESKFSREKQKKRGMKRLINSFKFSFRGIKYAFKYEQSMSIHVVISFLIIILGFILGLNLIEWVLILILMGCVISSELINTSIEAVLDLTYPNIHPIAKIAKDTSAAAVLIFSIIAFTGGSLILVPKIIDLIK